MVSTHWDRTSSIVANFLSAEALGCFAFRFVPAADCELAVTIGRRSIMTVAAPRPFGERMLDFGGQGGKSVSGWDVAFH